MPDSPCTADQLDRELSAVGSSSRTDAVCCSGNGRLDRGGCECNLGYFPALLDDPLKPRARLCATKLDSCTRDQMQRAAHQSICRSKCCSGHGNCTAAGTCACEGGWCAIDDCNVTGIGDHHACAFNVSGIYAERAGIYAKTSHICNGKPVYQKSDGDVLFLFQPDDWRISDMRAATKCGISDCWVSSWKGDCPESPDGVGCVGKWSQWPFKTIDGNITVQAV